MFPTHQKPPHSGLGPGGARGHRKNFLSLVGLFEYETKSIGQIGVPYRYLL